MSPEQTRQSYYTLTAEQLTAFIEALIFAREETKQMRELATINEITGLPNKRGLDIYLERMRREFERNKVSNTNVLVVYGDLKSFKNVNENFGDAIGNTVLRAVGNALVNCHRPEDFVGNPYGDTYFMVMPLSTPNDPDKQVSAIGHKIALTMEQLEILADDSSGQPKKITPQLEIRHQIMSINDDFSAMLDKIRSDKNTRPRNQVNPSDN